MTTPLISDTRVEAKGTITRSTFGWLAFENHNITILTFSQNRLGTLISGYWQVATKLPERYYFKLWIPTRKWLGFQLDLLEGLDGDILNPSIPEERYYYNIIAGHILQLLLDYYRPDGFLRLDDFWNPQYGFFGSLHLKLAGDEVTVLGVLDEEFGITMQASVNASDLFEVLMSLRATGHVSTPIFLSVEDSMAYYGCTPNGYHHLYIETKDDFVTVTFPVDLPSSIEAVVESGPYKTVGVKIEDFVGLVTLLQEVHQGR